MSALFVQFNILRKLKIYFCGSTVVFSSDPMDKNVDIKSSVVLTAVAALVGAVGSLTCIWCSIRWCNRRKKREEDSYGIITHPDTFNTSI